MRKIFLCLILAGCASKTVYKPIEMEIPVAVPCRPPLIAKPEWPTQSLSDKSAFYEQVRALIAENEVRKGYEAQLEASVKACQR